MMQVEMLEARAAIADLVHTYALNIRRGNGADCAALFTEDAVFEIGDAMLDGRNPVQVRTSLKGRDVIRAYLVRAAGSGVRVYPMIHNLLIEVEGWRATSSCLMTGRVSKGQGVFGEYRDSFQFDKGWRFSARVFTILSSEAPSSANGESG